jgi:Tfp pilus assembly PilM family ATPase
MSRFKRTILKIQKERWHFFPLLFALLKDEVREVLDSIRMPQCICVDLGTQQIKYVLVRNTGKDIQVVKFGKIDLKEDALLTQEEVNQQLGKVISELGDYPLTVLVPQNQVTSQTIHVPEELDGASPKEIKQYLRSVTTPGMTSSSFVIGYRKLFGLVGKNKTSNLYYTSIAKEQSVNELVGRFVNAEAPIINVLASLNAAASGFIRKAEVQDETLVLVDIGAISTHALVIHKKQSVLAANFPIGGEYLTQHLSKALRCTFEEAEQLKRQHNYLAGDYVNAIFQTAVKRWLKDLMSWLMELARSAENIRNKPVTEEQLKEPLQRVPIYLSGGASLTPGLLDYLCLKSGGKFLPWPQYQGIPEDLPVARYAACLGGGMETLKVAPDLGSLTPNYLLDAYKVNQVRFRALAAALVLMPVLFLLLLILTTSAIVASFKNTGKVKDIQTTIQKAESIISVYQTRDRELFNYAPVLRKRKRTMDVLNILKFQQDMVVSSTNQMWVLLLADKHTYTQGSPSLDNHTNTVLKMGDEEEISLCKYTYISELCLLTNRSPDPQKLFLTTVRDEMTNLFFIDYADTLLPSFFNTNYIDPKYLVGGDRFGAIFTTKGFLSENSVHRFSQSTTTNQTPIQGR